MSATNRGDRLRPRVLIADDQRDVLEALRLLLKGEGFESETAVLARRRARGPGGARLRRRAHRPELHARHDLGRTRGSTCSRRIQRARPEPARRRDDGLGQRRPRRRGHAPRRARLRPEALGQRAAPDDAPHPDRARPRAPRGAAASRRRTAFCARRGARADRGVAGDAARPRPHRAGRPLRRQRPDHRRERHRQGHRRPRPPRRVPARRASPS